MKPYLPDINVWIALISDRHLHHERAKAWFDLVAIGGAAFCRVTQMGFLRLITNRQVMGADVVTQKAAWQVYQKLTRDERVVFFYEPLEIEDKWRQLTQRGTAATNTWTDAYLCAFAAERQLQVVSFDADLRRGGADAIILKS